MRGTMMLDDADSLEFTELPLLRSIEDLQVIHHERRIAERLREVGPLALSMGE
jgi:hypothetical protein